MAQSAVSTVLGSVGNLAVQETSFLCAVTLEVGFLKDELARLQGYLRDADNKHRTGNARVAVLVDQIRAAAYEAQNAIEAADHMEKRNRLKKGFMGSISRYARFPTDLATLRKIGVDIQRVKRKLKEIFESADRLKIDVDATNVVLVEEYPQDCWPIHQNVEDDTVMVGFQDEYTEIEDNLVHGGQMLGVVSIVAMGGAGKTTLARKVYTSSIVQRHFNTTAWVTVSQKFKGVDLLKDVMNQIIGDKDESIDQMQELEVGKKISESLFEKRYLVVLDDVWEEDTWEQINRMVKAFPDANNGSRVLLTTRKEKVATHVEMPTHVHVLKKLDEEESWELFRSKALPSYRRSLIGDVGDFEELGRAIARKCDGLPLALAVLGGYLSNNLRIQTWSDILSCWPSTKKTQMMRDILARSYNDMPNHYLRSCFLYLATFPEDHRIDVSIIIKLWIAEGFIPNARKHELEETAHKYVAELAQRSLVQITRRSKVHGWIEEIRVHDILRDWCIEEARHDGFLDVVDITSGQVGAPSNDIVRSYRCFYQDFSAPNLKETRNIRSLIGFQLHSRSLPKFRLVRVIHIENSRLKDLSSTIEGCIHLRCLMLVNCKSVTLPSSIGDFLSLQTIHLDNTFSVIPKSLWDIPALRHVYFSNGFYSPTSVQHEELQSFKLDLRGVDASKCISLKKVRCLGKMTQLTTLWLKASEGTFPGELMNILAKMPLLVEIRIYKMRALDKLPESHHLPQGLHSFSLSADAIDQDPMPVLEKLPCLVVLELEGYTGQAMSCSAKGFPRLRNLELLRFADTEEWKIEAGAMPKLSQLTLYEFPKMSKLSEGLLHLPSLNQLGIDRLISRDDYTLKELQQRGCKVNR